MAALSRRDFFGELFNVSRPEVKAGLEEHTAPLTRDQVRHLLQRVSFVLNSTVIDKYVGKSANEVVNSLFQNAHSKTNPSFPAFVHDRLLNPINQSGAKRTEAEQLLGKHRGDYNYDLGGWWVSQMKNDAESVLEKLTFFWHGHLTTQYANCESIPAIPMYYQNDLFRKNFAGNFYTLLAKITIDGAMLVYLNGKDNISEAPNENYARELLELYSLGVGNYTEQDIKEAAKILTGWKMSYFADDTLIPNRGWFNAAQFDRGSKKFFDEVFTVTYEVNQENVYNHSVRKLIEVILTKKGNIAAKFMMNKFYKYYVYANPNATDMAIVDQLASKLIENKFEFEPVLKILLKSKHFFDEANRGIQLKSPAETIINFVHHFKFIDVYARNVMASLGLELFNPPNVGGWKGYRSWVSTKSLPTTIYYIHEILGYNTSADLGDWAIKISGNQTLETSLARILECFHGRKVDYERWAFYKSKLANSDSEWNSLKNNRNALGDKVKSLLVEIVKAPEFYLA